MSELIVKIPQRLQDPPRFLLWPVDDVAAFAVPVLAGLSASSALTGLVLGVFFFKLWRKLKGARGLTGMITWLYWWIPDFITPFKSFPKSHVTTFEG